MPDYILMHKNIECGTVAIDGSNGALSHWRSRNTGIEPFLGNSTIETMKTWWAQRSVPGSRKMIEEVVRKSGSPTNGSYLAKNLGLSLTDTYWIKPLDSQLQWEDVTLWRQIDINQGKIPYHNAMSYDPNASLGGQMEKYWDMNTPVPTLVKKASGYHGQQAVNELFATRIHELQDNDIPYVRYKLFRAADESMQSVCPAFTSENIEFVSAYEVVNSRPQDNNKSSYESYIDICAANGIDREIIQRFMDYLTSTDFLLTNTDEHLMNLGITRHADTCRLIGPAPIFDSGNTMFYTDEGRKLPLTRVQILEREITSFHSSEEKMLAKVKDRNVIKTDLLPSPQETAEFYASYGVPEQKALMIAGSYGKKLDMFSEFQHGKTISLYHEKQKERGLGY